MLTLPQSVRVFALKTPVRATIGIDGLVRLAREGATEDPLSGSIFCFFNRHRAQVRLLVWDRNGFWVMSKRLEHGRFERIAGGSRWVELDREQLVLLLEGKDTRTSQLRRHFAREVRITPREHDA